MVNGCKGATDSYCKFCQRFGQFLPVRISIGLKNESIDILKPHPSVVAKLPKLPYGYEYILRRLNEGYIYTFSEKWMFPIKQDEDKLNLYKVNKNGFIKELNKSEIDVEDTSEKCFESLMTSAGQSLSEIFLLDLYPVEGNDVSVVYTRHRLSDQAYKNLNNDESIRNQIMQKFDIQGNGVYEFLMGKNLVTKVLDNQQETLEPTFSKIAPWDSIDIFKNEKRTPFSVSQYLKEDEDGNSIYTDIVNRNSKGEEIARTSHFVTGNAIIVLNDPIGIIEDLVKIINYQKKNITANLYGVECQTYQSINALKKFEYNKIYSENFRKVFDTKYIDPISKEVKTYTSSEINIMTTTDVYKLRKESDASKLNMLHEKGELLTNKELDGVGSKSDEEFNRVWNRYKHYYNEKRMNNEIKDIAYKVQVELDSILKPILLLYIDYFKSDVLYDYFNFLFDHKSVDSAGKFLDILAKIIQNIDGYNVVSNFFVELMDDSNSENPKNYLARGLSFDNPIIFDGIKQIDEIFKEYKVSETSKYIVEKWKEKNGARSAESFFSFVKFSQMQLKEQTELISEMIGGSFIKSTSRHMDRKNGPFFRSKLMIGFEIFSGKQFIVKDYSGNYKKILKSVINDFNTRYSSELSRVQKNQAKKSLEKSLSKILSTQFDSKLSNDSSERYRMTVLIDSEINIEFDTSNFDKNINLEGKVNSKEYFLSNTEQAYIDNKKLEFESSLIGAKKYNSRLRGFSAFSLGLDVFGLVNIIERMTKQKIIDLESYLELVGSLSSVAGSIVDVVILNKTSQLINIQKLNGLRVVSTEVSLLQKGIEKSITNLNIFVKEVLYINIIVSVFIGISGIQKNTNNTVLAVMYGVSAAASIASSILFILGATGWGIALVAVAFAVDLYIKHLESQKVKDYLRHSRWGLYNENWNIIKERKAYLYAIS